MTSFDSFDLDPQIQETLKRLTFEAATPIQAEAIPPLLEGHDIIGQARTGSGKTAAFGLPLLERFKEGGKVPRALVLCPTRELALQVTEALRSYAGKLPIRITTIYGGAPYPPQLKALKKGVSIVVGTPGRVIDHMERGSLKLGKVDHLVLDEADEMLRMGFMEAVETVMQALPETRQIALFSATMPPPIERLARTFLTDPVLLKVESKALSVDHIEQRWIRIPSRQKIKGLIRLLQGEECGATLVFCRTRAGCAKTADELAATGLSIDAIHGDLNQAARERVLKRFRAEKLQVLVATDVAARGLDVSHITHVINFDYPGDSETYVHRIGRTGRAGAHGIAITFVTPDQQRKLRILKKTTKATIIEMQLPTASDVGQIQRNALIQELAERIKGDALTEARKWLTKVTEESDLSAEDLAAAALHLLAEKQGLNLAIGRNDELARDPEARKKINEVELYLGGGKGAGIRAGDIVGTLANEFSLSGSDIGRIQVLEHASFVGMTRSNADRILDQADKIELRGRHITIALAKSSERGEASPSRKRDGKRGGRGDGKSGWKGKGKFAKRAKSYGSKKGKSSFSKKKKGPRGGKKHKES